MRNPPHTINGIPFQEWWNNSGVYKIQIGQYFYFGITRRPFHMRFKRHLSDLVCNRHVNKKMQAVYNKYGNQIQLIEVKACADDEARMLEHLLIRHAKNMPACMNLHYEWVDANYTNHIPKCVPQKAEKQTKAKAGCNETKPVRIRCPAPRKRKIENRQTKYPHLRVLSTDVSFQEKKRIFYSDPEVQRRYSEIRAIPLEVTFIDGTVVQYKSSADASRQLGCERNQPGLMARKGTGSARLGIVSVRKLL